MHILLIHQAFASTSDPGGTRHFEFAQHFGDAGHRTTVIAGAVSYLTSAPLENQRHAGIDVIRPYTYPALHRSFLARVLSFLSFMVSSFASALRVPDVDVVFGTSPPIFQALTAWAVARLKRVPFVMEVRDLWPDFAVELGVLRNPLTVALARRFERFLYRHADQLVVNSPGFVDHVSRVAGRAPVLVANGVDVSLFTAAGDADAVRARWHAADRFVVLYAGAHGMANDLVTLLDAAALLTRRIDVQFVLLGDGKEKPRLREYAASRGLDNVLFADPAKKQDMPAVLAAADVGLAILKDIPLFRTTYPNKVFDYMAAGKPCLVAIEGVIRDVVEHARCGICVPPGNPARLAAAVEALADDRSACAAMGARGREYVATHFSRRRQASTMMNLLEQVARHAIA